MTPAARAIIRATVTDTAPHLRIGTARQLADRIADALDDAGWNLTPDPTRIARGKPTRAARITTP